MNDWVNEDNTPYIRMKAERDELIDDISWYKAKASRLERELASALNGELIKYDELQEYVLELQSELMECQKENEKLNSITEEAMDIAESENYKVQRLERENEMIDEQFTDYIGETSGYLKLLSEFSQHIGNKPSNSTYKYFRAKLDDIGIEEDE